MATPPLVALRGGGIQVDGRAILGGISVALGLGDRVCLVGRNGTGKSTLLKALAGEVELESGTVFRQPGARIAYAPQLPAFDPDLTAAEYVGRGLVDRHLVEAALDEVGIRPGQSLATLSGGEGRRVSLARALAGDPDILLLDEPTHHLDIAAIEWLEERLATHRAGLLLISHDRAFLTRLSRRTLWLDRGALREHDQGYAGFDEWSEGIFVAESAAAARLRQAVQGRAVWSPAGNSGPPERHPGTACA